MTEKNAYSRNKVSIFLVPALEINPSELKSLGFVNGYLMDINCEKDYNNCLFLLFKPEQALNFGAFIEQNTERIVGEYDYEGGFTVLVFEFPVKFIVNYMHFLSGKYTKFTDEYKRIFNKLPSAEELKEAVYVEDKRTKEKFSLPYATFHKSSLIREDLENLLGQRVESEEVVSLYSEKWDVLDFYTLFNKTHETEPQ